MPHPTLLPVIIMKCLIWSVPGTALLFPLLAQAAETRGDAASATAIALVSMRDPRMAGLSISELLPAEPAIRNNTVRYPVLPVAAAPSPSWAVPPSGPSPLLTYIGAVATSIAVGNPRLPTYNQTPPAATTFDDLGR